MTPNEISLIMKAAKDTYGTTRLAEMLEINPVQVSAVIRGKEAVPFCVALQLAELLQADPLTVTCANAALMEKNPTRKAYLESKILPLEISRIICAMSTKEITSKNSRNLPYKSRKIKQNTQKVLQSAKKDRSLPPDNPRNVPFYRRREQEMLSTWALRPIPSYSESD